MRTIFPGVFLILLPFLATAGTVLVPTDQPTIQAGIDAAATGDTVLVASGIYHENIDFSGKSIVLLSTAGRDSTFVEPSISNQPVVSFENSEDTNSVIDGFTIRYADNAYGILCSSASPIIKNCDVSFCEHDGNGAGIWLYGAPARILDCRIHDNSANGGIALGAGIGGTLNDGSVVTNCEIFGNTSDHGPGIGLMRSTNLIITRNLIYDNHFGGAGLYGHALYLQTDYSLIVNNTIVQNDKGVAEIQGGASHYRNNLVSENLAEGFYPRDASTAYNLVWGNGSGNDPGDSGISEDPLLFNALIGDLRLAPGSPCIDAGDPAPEYNDPDGSRNDIGALPFVESVPLAYRFNVDPEDILHVTDHTPELHWSVIDTSGTYDAYVLEVGTDTDWSVAELWSTGQVLSPDTSIVYSGATLVDGQTAYVRLRVRDLHGWGLWLGGKFRLNTPPSIPTPVSPLTAIPHNSIQLTVATEPDAEKDTVYCDFELYGDATLSSLLFSDYGVLVDGSVALSGIYGDLDPNGEYWWRARCFDSTEYSDWCEVLHVTASATPGVLHVPSEFATIQIALDVAIDGDSILVAPGTYVENITIDHKAIALVGTGGREVTTIVGDSAGIPVVSIISNWDIPTVLEGFAITNPAGGCGFYGHYDKTTIRNCEFYSCASSGLGGGLQFYHTKSLIEDNIIRGNSAAQGGGIGADTPVHPRIAGNLIYDNSSDVGAGIMLDGGYSTVERNLIFANTGTGDYAAGICDDRGEHDVINNTITGNSHGICTSSSFTSKIMIVNNIVAFNLGFGVNIHADQYPRYNNVWGNGESGQYFDWYGISEDPHFVDPINHDYSLQPYSPCIDRGHPDTTYTDADGTRNDMGALPFSYVLPVAANVTYPEERPDRLVDHTPETQWHLHDTVVNTQYAYLLEVSTSQTSFTADMWATGSVVGDDTTVEYAGGPLIDGETYYSRLRLMGASGWGDWKYSTFRMNSIPGVPTPLTPRADQQVAASAAQLVVDSASNVDGDTITYDFEIYYEYADTVPVLTQTGARDVRSMFFGGLESNHRYWWRARAFDKYEHSDWSELVNFRTRDNGTLLVPGDYATIQAALDVASPGDTILVSAGTYRGEGNRDLLFYEKTVVLKATLAGAAVIDCEGTEADPHRAFVFPSRCDPGTEIIGFEIRGGQADTGGAVYGYRATVAFRNCTFRNNQAFKGGAISGLTFNASLTDCQFIENSASCGGALAGLGGEIAGCSFLRNSADWGGAVDRCGDMQNCYFEGNSAETYGAAIYSERVYIDGCTFVDHIGAYVISSDAATFRHCTFYGNSHIVYVGWMNGYVLFENCIIAFNTGVLSYCDWLTDRYGTYQGEADLSHCLLYGNASDYSGCFSDDEGEDGNLLEDPLFCDTASHVFDVAGASPALGAGTEGSDIGAFGYGCFPTDVDDDAPSGLPTAYQLYQSYPNPFNSETSISFDLPIRSDVRLEVFNVLGQRIETLMEDRLPAGSYSIGWDCQACASGVYFYRLSAGDYVSTRKMLLLK